METIKEYQKRFDNERAIDLIQDLKQAQDFLTCKQIDHAAMGEHGRSFYAAAERRLDEAENALRAHLNLPLLDIDPDAT